jgi:tRNA-binding EMAP/Myf-like protein
MFTAIYQPDLFPKTLFVYLSPHLKPNRVVTHGDLTLLYVDDQCLGFNVFQLPDTVTNQLVSGNQRHFHPILKNYLFDLLSPIKMQHLLENFHSGFVTGQIISVEPHEDSDHLFICKVRTKEELTIVTNSTKVKPNDIVVVAMDMAITALGQWILKGPIMKIHSDGMFCSEKTLGLKETQPGVLVLKQEVSVGEDFYATFRN